jgi:hypothetical protein
MLRTFTTVERMLVGTASGAAVGFALYYVVARPTTGDEPNLAVAFVSIVAILGGLAGGLVSREGWLMLTGALVGAIAVGLLGVVATLHPKGLIYSIFGGPLGAVAVYLYFRAIESPVPTAKAKALPRTEGIRDRELDR